VRRERRRGRVEAVLEAVWEAALEEGLARHLRRRRWEVILGRVVEARGGGEAAREDRLGEERARMVEPGHARERSQTPQMPASNLVKRPAAGERGAGGRGEGASSRAPFLLGVVVKRSGGTAG